MTIVELPSRNELQLLEDIEPGSGKKRIQLHLYSIKKKIEQKDRELDAKEKHQKHIQKYRYFSVAAGCLLALASLALCAFFVYMNADITPLAYILGPLAGLAGVFIWGYRPSKGNKRPS
jgi:hypothetical protein